MNEINETGRPLGLKSEVVQSKRAHLTKANTKPSAGMVAQDLAWVDEPLHGVVKEGAAP